MRLRAPGFPNPGPSSGRKATAVGAAPAGGGQAILGESLRRHLATRADAASTSARFKQPRNLRGIELQKLRQSADRPSKRTSSR